MHDDKHPLAGTTVTVDFGSKGNINGVHNIEVEDWWDHLTGGSWKWAEGNPACLMFAMRNGLNGRLVTDDEVLYGHDPESRLGHLFHESEIV